MSALPFKHCDDYIDDAMQPFVLRRFLHWARLPAVCKYLPAPEHEDYVDEELRPFIWRRPAPKLFADFEGRRVRVTMASRFGDVGISRDLTGDGGYFKRVAVEDLGNFGDEP